MNQRAAHNRHRQRDPYEIEKVLSFLEITSPRIGQGMRFIYISIIGSSFTKLDKYTF